MISGGLGHLALGRGLGVTVVKAPDLATRPVVSDRVLALQFGNSHRDGK